MKCQKCGKEEVNFRYSLNINGKISEIHLCAECAAETGYAETFSRPEEMFGGFFDSFFRPRSSFFPIFSMDMPMRPVLGIRPMSAVREREAEIAPPKTEIKVEIDEKMQKRREINILREQMRQAADAEDFEKATELRDKIRNMEQDVQG